MSEYECERCDHRFELDKSRPVVVCPECHRHAAYVTDDDAGYSLLDFAAEYAGDTDAFTVPDGEDGVTTVDDVLHGGDTTTDNEPFDLREYEGDANEYRCDPAGADGTSIEETRSAALIDAPDDRRGLGDVLATGAYINPPESAKESDDSASHMGDDVCCGTSGCEKEAIAKVLDADDVIGDDPNRCLDCLEYHLRDNYWGQQRW